MSGGVEAAATLTLDVRTDLAEEKLDRLEARINSLGTTKTNAPSFSSFETAINGLRVQIADLGGSLEALASRSLKSMSGATREVELTAQASLSRHAKHVQSYFESVSKEARATSSAIKSVTEAMTHRPADFAGLSHYYSSLQKSLPVLQQVRQSEEAWAAATKARVQQAVASITKQKEGLADLRNYYLQLESKDAVQISSRLQKEEALEAASYQRRLKLSSASAKARQAEEAKYTQWWAAELAKQDSAYQSSILGSVSNLKEQEAAQIKSDRTRLESASKTIKARQAEEAKYTQWWAAELAKQDAAFTSSQMRRAQLTSKLSTLNVERLDRSLIAPSPGTSQLAQYYASIGAERGGGSALASIEAAETARLAASEVEAAQAARTLAREQERLGLTHRSTGAAASAAAGATTHYTEAQWNAHAAARGLAGSLGQLWMTYGALAPLMTGAALGAAAKTALSLGTEFEYQLTFVKALGGESAEAVERLSAAAKNLAANGLFGPTEIASGMRVLAQAGLSANEALLAIRPTLDLATVGEMGMADAAETLVGVMKAFKLSVVDSAMVGDVFAKAAAVSQVSVSDMTQAMRMASVVGEQYNASIGDTAAALTLLGQVNIKGTAAGTSLRNMLKELYTPSKQAAEVMKQLGISASDAQGNLRPFPEIIYDLRNKLAQFDKVSQVNILQKIFGERGAKEAVAMLAQTREGWAKLRSEIADSSGFMRRVAEDLESSTKGTFTQAFNAMRVAAVRAYEDSASSVGTLAASLKRLFDSDGFRGSIRLVIEGITGLVGVIDKLSPLLLTGAAAWGTYRAASLAAAAAVAATNRAAVLAAGAGLASAAMQLQTLSAVARGAATTLTGSSGLVAALGLLVNPSTLAAAALLAIGGGLVYLATRTPDAVSKSDQLSEAISRQNEKLQEQLATLRELNGEKDKQSAIDEADLRAKTEQRLAVVRKELRDRLRSADEESPMSMFTDLLGFGGKTADLRSEEENLSEVLRQLDRSKQLREQLSIEAERRRAQEKAEFEQYLREIGQGTSQFVLPDPQAMSRERQATITNLKSDLSSIANEYKVFVEKTKGLADDGEISIEQMFNLRQKALVDGFAKAREKLDQMAVATGGDSRLLAQVNAQSRQVEDAYALNTERLNSDRIKAHTAYADAIEAIEVASGKRRLSAAEQAGHEFDVQNKKVIEETIKNIMDAVPGAEEAWARISGAKALKELTAQANSDLGLLGRDLSDFKDEVGRLTEHDNKAGIFDVLLGSSSKIESLKRERIAQLHDALSKIDSEISRMKESGASPDILRGLEIDREKIAREIDQIDRDVVSPTIKRWGDTLGDYVANGLVYGFDKGESPAKMFAKMLKQELYNAIASALSRQFTLLINGIITGNYGGGAQGTIGSVASLADGANKASNIWNAWNNNNFGAGVYGNAISGAGNLFGSSSISAFGSGMGLTSSQAAAAAAQYQAAAATAQASGNTAAAQTYSSTANSLQAGSAAGSVAAYLNGAAIGYSVGKLISNGYSVSGKSGNQAVVTGTAIGSIFGPLGAAIGGAIGGLINRAFGMRPKKVTDYGIDGTFSTDGADISSYQNWKQKGGWLRSDKKGTKYNDLGGSDFENVITDTLVNITAAEKQYAEALGLSASAVDGFSKQMHVSLKGLNAEQQKEEITKAIQNWKDAMVSAAYGDTIGIFAKEGETASQTLERLVADLTGVNTAIKTLGGTMLEMGVNGASAASALIDLFGGIDTFKQSTDAYYQAFYTDQERLAVTTQQLRDAFSELNLQMPDTKEGFRALVDAQDLMTVEGRTAYVALMNIAPAFAQVSDAASAAADTAAQAKQKVDQERYGLETQLLQLQGNTPALRARELDQLDDSNRALQTYIWALQDASAAQQAAAQSAADAQAAAHQRVADAQANLRSAYESQANALQQTIDKFGDLAARLREFRTGLLTGNDSPLSPAARDAEMSRQFEAVARRAQIGDPQAIEDLQSISSQYLDVSKESAASAEDYYRRFAKVQDVLGKSESVASRQASIAQDQLGALHAQISTLLDIDSGVMSVAGAINALRAAMADAAAADKAASGSKTDTAGTDTAGTDTAGTDLDAYKIVVDQAFHDVLGRSAAAAGLDYWSGQLKSGAVDFSHLHENIAYAALDPKYASMAAEQAAARDWLHRVGVPGYATGGDFSGGLRLVGESGPELEVTGPSRIYSAAQTRDLLAGAGGNQALIAEIRALRAEVANLRAAGDATARNTHGMNKRIQGWDNDGMPDVRAA